MQWPKKSNSLAVWLGTSPGWVHVPQGYLVNLLEDRPHLRSRRCSRAACFPTYGGARSSCVTWCVDCWSRGRSRGQNAGQFRGNFCWNYLDCQTEKCDLLFKTHPHCCSIQWLIPLHPTLFIALDLRLGFVGWVYMPRCLILHTAEQ